MDGTIVDSTQTWIDADNEFGFENGFVYTEEILMKTKTLKFMKACEYLSQFCNLSPEETARRYYKILKEKYADSPLTAGVLDFLNYCKSKGIKMCILTAGIRELVDSVMIKHSLEDVFEFIATADHIDTDKREAKAFTICAEKLGVDIANVLVFEDSAEAAEAAVKAGAAVIGVLNDYNTTEHDILRNICVQTIRDFTIVHI
jgi:HAD superfamily hydrolase (TIGR01509 family)